MKRSHQGYRLNGRTPAQALREALGISAKKLPNLRFKTETIVAETASSTTTTEATANTTTV